MFSGNLLTLLNDTQFPDQTIKHFSAAQFYVAEDELLDHLYLSLSPERQTLENRQLLEKALSYKINASSDVILMINTNDGLQLLYAHSQRRRRLVSTNGACEPGETLADSAYREFREELGNPRQSGLLDNIVSQPSNRRALKFKNKIGSTFAEMANRIIDLQADKNRLFVNLSSVFVNDSPVNMRDLEREINDINVRLQSGAPFYMQAVKLVYGDRKAGVAASNFSSYADIDAACTIINNFSATCQAIITDELRPLFAKSYDVNEGVEQIKKALSAIIDLTENDWIGLIPRQELEALLSIDYSVKENLDKLMQYYFDPSFMSLVIHKGELTAREFLNQFESRSYVNRFGINSSSTEAGHGDDNVVKCNYKI